MLIDAVFLRIEVVVPGFVVEVGEVRVDEHLGKLEAGQGDYSRIIVQANMRSKTIIHKIICDLHQQLVIQPWVIIKCC